MLCNLFFYLKGCVIPAADTFWRGIFSTKLLSVFSIKLSNIFSLLSGKCQPGWTLLDDTCWMYHGGPMTYKQGLAFCAKDNATLPTLRNYYQYHLLAAYLNREQVSIAQLLSISCSPRIVLCSMNLRIEIVSKIG